ncbi:hypothetical protein ACFLWT_00710, partial [Chloroflexota bacterium]
MSLINLKNANGSLIIAEKRRQHLSNAIIALNGLAITLILGIWTFFLKGFFDHSSLINPATSNVENQPFAFSYITLAAGLTCIVIALWRWYARYLDDCLSNLYPEIMLYERVLGVSSDAGVERYLSKNKELKEVFSTLSREKREKLVDQLVKDRHVGRRGHLPFDI